MSLSSVANGGFDVERARRETRYCNDLVHFNNAGASLMPVSVTDVLRHYLDLEERYGGYEVEAREQTRLDNFYVAAARLLGCQPDEIAYAESATKAWDMAFYSFRFQLGDKILTSFSDYGSNVVAYAQQAKRYGVEIEFVPDDAYGQIDVQALENRIDERVKLISISHIPTGNGLVNPAAEVGKVAKAAGVPYLLDSCQGLGQMPVDVDAIGCDVVCGTGRKYLRGPRGTGLLYMRKSLMEKLEPPMLDQHAADLVAVDKYTLCADMKRYESWEQYCAGKLALGVAIDYALSFGLEAIWHRVQALANQLREGLATLPNVNVMDTGKVQCGIVTFMVEGEAADAVKARLYRQGINVSVSKGAGSFVGYQQRGITEVVRASVHYYNTIQEIETLLQALEK